MKIKIGKSYRSERRHRIRIWGFAQCDPIDGQKIYSSIEGNWYAADGRYVLVHQVSREPLITAHTLAQPDHPENITIALEEKKE